MKKVLAAGIKQLLEFDSEKEMYVYIGDLRAKCIEHRCIDYQKQANGKVRLLIIKAYNQTDLLEG